MARCDCQGCTSRRNYKREYMRAYRGGKREPFPVEQATALYLAGHSSSEIAEEYGVSYMTVLNHLRRAGVPIKPQGGARNKPFVVGVTSRGRVKDADRRLV